MKNKKDIVLINWMKEFFPYGEFRKAGIFTKEMRGDYKAQAEHICTRLGLKSIYEYGKNEIRCHISYVNPDCPSGICTNGRPLSINKNGDLKSEPFITIIPSIWNEQQVMPIDIDGSKYDEGDEEPGDGDADIPVLTKPPKAKI
jgi:hypothetical protein